MTTFWDSFESAIDRSPGLSEIDKFNYLRSLLEKSTSEAISGLTLTAENYQEAVAILKRRFGNKQQIISKHMDILLNLESISQHNVKGLRHLYDLVETQIRCLKSLGVDSESNGSLLTSVLIQRLPSELQLILSREVGEESWNLDALMQRLHEEIAARERVNAVTKTVKKQERDGTGSLNTTANLFSSGHSPSCCYCQQSHPSGSCDSVVDVEKRKQVLKKAGRCFICLKKYHISKQCRLSAKCQKCSGRQHLLQVIRGSFTEYWRYVS